MRYLPRLKTDNALRLGAWFVLLVAILPNAIYLGHGPLTGDIAVARGATTGHQHTPDAVPQPAPAADDHSVHCHTGPSKCGGAQSLVGSIWVGEDAGLLALDARPELRQIDETHAPMESLSEKILQPPQYAVV